VPRSKGHLNPGSSDVVITRFEVGAEVSELVRHVWVVRWDVPAGQVSPQRVLTYPAFNLVVMGKSAALYGPNPKVEVRRLSGQGWALGILLRPAAGPLLASAEPRTLVGASEPVRGAPVDEIAAALGAPAPAWSKLVERWLGPVAARVDEQGRLANHACRIVEEDSEVVRVAELARRVGMSARSLERLISKHVGVTPKWLIECRRLQDAATTLFASPDISLTQLAFDLHYVDYAHFSRRYKEVLGETPDETRASARSRVAR
jgi:AraC-like DNA-binding protein